MIQQQRRARVSRARFRAVVSEQIGENRSPSRQRFEIEALVIICTGSWYISDEASFRFIVRNYFLGFRERFGAARAYLLSRVVKPGYSIENTQTALYPRRGNRSKGDFELEREPDICKILS